MNILKEKNIYFLIVLIFLSILVGCSSDNIGAVFPDNQNKSNPDVTSSLISETSDNETTGEEVLGLYQGFINLEKLEGELIPIRITGSGTSDSVEVDITSFLTESPCHDCARLLGLALDGSGHPIMSIGVKHPFQPGDVSKPPTAMNRLDLHVFNVRGFIVSDGFTTKQTFNSMDKTIGGFNLISADGFSGEFDTYWDNYHLTESNLHPYVLHFDDYSTGNFDPTNENGFTDLANPSGNLVMKMGADYYAQNYIFDFKYPVTASFEFLYTLTASYGVSAAGKNQRLIPTYRIPQFNSKAASEVRVTEVEDSQLISGDTESKCYITLEIKDINHGIGVGDGLDQMSADSSISRIDVEIPGVTNPIWSTTTPSDYYIEGDGRNTPLVYNLVVTNDDAAETGNYSGIVKIVDAFTGAGNLPGNAIYRIAPGQDPTEAFFTVDEWATYAIFNVVVHAGCGPITGSITIPVEPTITIMDKNTVSFSGEGSSANGGDPIVQYKWSWGDGSMNSLGQNAQHQFHNPNCQGSMEPVTYTVKLTLTDSCVPPNVTEVDNLSVTVECPTCINYYEDFDGGTTGSWAVTDWTVENTDDSGLYYGGWDEYNNHLLGPNCSQSMCNSGNCYFTSGDNISQGMSGGFCNDYSGTGHYYLTSPIIDLSRPQVAEITLTINHFFNVLNSTERDGCAVYISTNGGATFPNHPVVLSGEGYNSTFNGGPRDGNACFTGITSSSGVVTTVFDLSNFALQDEVVIRFEQHNANMGSVGTPGFPVGWWIDDVLIDICL